MNSIDREHIEVAFEALIAAGITDGEARLIALRTVADRLTRLGNEIAERANYANGVTYHRERRRAGELMLRARALEEEADRLEEARA